MAAKNTVVDLPLLGGLTYREIHAFEDGLYVGYRGLDTTDEEEYDEEKHYWRMGWLTGRMMRKYVD